MHSFQLIGLDHAQFEPLFDLSDTQLAEIGAQRRIAMQGTGFPCRVSLEDAREGEALLLLPFVHQPAASPYRASGPIFVRRGVKRRAAGIGEIPGYVSRRLISARAYDAAHMITNATVCEGSAVQGEISRLLSDSAVAYIHLHYAKYGCFSCRVDRA